MSKTATKTTKTASPKARDARSRGDYQGMNWIRQDKRLAIYLRDGMACAYCGAGAEVEGVSMSLDHVKPHSNGGSNSERNLVTCCTRCNSSRGDRQVSSFAAVAALYVNDGRTAKSILIYIRSNTRKSLTPFRAEAKELITRRGSAAKAVAIAAAGDLGITD